MTEKKCRVRLAVTTDGEPQLWLYDAHETPRIAAGVSPAGGAVLGLANRDRKATIALNMSPDGNASLDLTDQEGKPRVTLGYAELEVSPGRITDKLPVLSLVLADPSGRVIWKAP